MTDYDANDDIQDERIRALAASHYNAPEGTVPREAMWEQISAARRAARTDAARPQPEADATVIPLASRRGSRTIVVWRWSTALAAGLILAFVLGRELGKHDVTPSAVRQQVAQQPAPSAGPTESTPAPAPDATLGTPDVVAPRSTGGAPQRVATFEPSRTSRASAEPAAEVAPRDSVAQTLYRAAAIQTLVQAEAVLTAYRGAESGAPDPQVMQQSARWARDVLSSTRLLMDSPAGRDPRMRSLFTDLELVLAQIVQLSGTPLQASERELIDRAMRERDLLPRLRSAVPAGLAASS
jgi:hypothetical protein